MSRLISTKVLYYDQECFTKGWRPKFIGSSPNSRLKRKEEFKCFPPCALRKVVYSVDQVPCDTHTFHAFATCAKRGNCAHFYHIRPT